MLANIVEKWCLRGWYKNQKIPDLCGGAEQLLRFYMRPARKVVPHGLLMAILDVLISSNAQGNGYVAITNNDQIGCLFGVFKK
ncbi:hypothetical protein [Endozoicomonas sp. SCSIO W0465]|uniref:hypothetical protein n=1 Tax=Endozoicomonas sp. SCSIO W0465 TaxID=2918516 RepID=UPI00207632E0|nr:hypothetical protein [Endozoicomonas sp. SCSIO W0465]USE39219.1 hypothetical protein MJO57_14300 [Endozoicomonas sp. SCSIO W0465]